MTTTLQIPYGDHILVEEAAWFTVSGFSVHINKTDEGIVVDIYKDGEEMGEPLGSTWVLDSDLENDDVQQNSP